MTSDGPPAGLLSEADQELKFLEDYLLRYLVPKVRQMLAGGDRTSTVAALGHCFLEAGSPQSTAMLAGLAAVVIAERRNRRGGTRHI